MQVADNERTRAYGIAGMQAVIEDQIAKDTYSVIVLDMDGLPAGPYTLTTDDLETDLDNAADVIRLDMEEQC